MIFTSIIKVLFDNFKTIYLYNFISSGGAGLSGDYYRRGGIHEIYYDFWECLGEFLIFLHKIFFGSKILSSTYDKHQKFDYGCPGNETQSPDFDRFSTI